MSWRRILCTIKRQTWTGCVRLSFSSSSKGTFISKYYMVEPQEFRRVIDSMNTEVRDCQNGGIEVKICRLCTKGNKEKNDNLWKLRVNKSGNFYCFRCSLAGSWFDLKRRCSGGADLFIQEVSGDIFGGAEDKKAVSTALVSTAGSIATVSNHTKYTKLTYLPRENNDDDNEVRNYLSRIRDLNLDVCIRYGVGYSVQKYRDDDCGEWRDELCITFPWMINERDLKQVLARSDADAASSLNAADIGISVIQRLKHRSIKTKGKQRLLPKGGGWGLFGYHTINSDTTEILITEGEFDTLAAAEAIFSLSASTSKEDKAISQIKVMSLPNGCNSLPPDLLPLLERFHKIYLWFDSDASGQAAIAKFSQKLGIHRCVVVHPLEGDNIPPKDANDAIRRTDLRNAPFMSSILANYEVSTLSDREISLLYIKEMIKHAKATPYDRIISFSSIRTEVLGLMHRKSAFEGTQTPSMMKLNRICKGFRRGELVIFTGPTGSGKTTFLSQLSLDFAKQDKATLWGSFEIKNSRLIQKMLHQFYQKGDLKLLDPVKLESIADDFENLPLQFLNFHGGTELSQVLEALDVAIYKYDVQHIIIDNLQFMMPQRQDRTGFDRFNLMDEAISQFRKFATEKQVNVIIVIHPKKEDDKLSLGISSIFGTAKATQESDLVLILQRIEGDAYLDVKKNRFDGDVGRISLEFSAMTSSFYEVDDRPEKQRKWH